MAEPEGARLRLIGASVIDGTGRAPMPDAVIEVSGERIVRVGPMGPEAGNADVDLRDARPSEGYDARGLTVIPGLIDSHVHVALSPVLYRAAKDPLAVTDTLLRAFVSAGVTAVRDPGSPDLGSFFRQLKAGAPHWPRFVGSGPLIDGPPGAPWAGTRVVSTPSEARAEATRLASGGADFLKVYFWISAPLARAVAEVAHEHGLRVAYHPGSLPVGEAIRCGVDQVEHALHALDLAADDRPALAGELAAAGWENLPAFRLWRRADPISDRARASVELMAERGTSFVPTLILTRMVVGGSGGPLATPAGVDRMPEAVRSRWASSAPRQGTPVDRRHLPEILDRQFAFVRLAHAAGVAIAAGTGGLGNSLVPGTSLHEELRLLVDAGLRPMEALMAATSTAAGVLGRSADLGSLAAGKLADFVVVRGDPSVDIGDVDRIVAVVKGGRFAVGDLPRWPRTGVDPGRGPGSTCSAGVAS